MGTTSSRPGWAGSRNRARPDRRAVADEQAIGPVLRESARRSFPAEGRSRDAALGEVAQDVVLGAAVEGDDVQPIAALDPAQRPVALVLRSSRSSRSASPPAPNRRPPSARRAGPCRRARASSSISVVEMMPRIAPLIRSLRVSARVSIPSMPMMSCSLEIFVEAQCPPGSWNRAATAP